MGRSNKRNGLSKQKPTDIRRRYGFTYPSATEPNPEVQIMDTRNLNYETWGRGLDRLTSYCINAELVSWLWPDGLVVRSSVGAGNGASPSELLCSGSES
jgi:hypothetical protein